MKPAPDFRSPFRPSDDGPSSVAVAVDRTKLAWALVLTKLALLGLCVARVATDPFRGSALTIEGDVALALSLLFAGSLVVKAIGWTIRRALPPTPAPKTPNHGAG
jgi:hypothetical protein